MFLSPQVALREIDRASQAEVTLVVQRMRQTLIDVMGESKAVALYSLDALADRLRWHLDPEVTNAKVYLSEDRTGHITGQAIARVEIDETGAHFGYFSTLFVEQESRRQGIATSLLSQVEKWFIELGMPKIVYNTAADNSRLIPLFQRHGYRITHSEGEMVQLTKLLKPACPVNVR
jgi:GNAT superfamily N-acetyltransferase